VQWFTATYAIVADCASFVWSAIFIAPVRAREEVEPPTEQPPILVFAGALFVGAVISTIAAAALLAKPIRSLATVDGDARAAGDGGMAAPAE